MNVTFTKKQLECLRQMMRLNLFDGIFAIAREECIKLVQTNDGGIPSDICLRSMKAFDFHSSVDIPIQFILSSNQPLYTMFLADEALNYFKALSDTAFERLTKDVSDFIEQEREGIKLALRGSRDLGNVFAMNCPKEIQ